MLNAPPPPQDKLYVRLLSERAFTFGRGRLVANVFIAETQRRRAVFNWGLCTQAPKALHLLHFYTAILNLPNLLNLLNLTCPNLLVEEAIAKPRNTRKTRKGVRLLRALSCI